MIKVNLFRYAMQETRGRVVLDIGSFTLPLIYPQRNSLKVPLTGGWVCPRAGLGTLAEERFISSEI